MGEEKVKERSVAVGHVWNRVVWGHVRCEWSWYSGMECLLGWRGRRGCGMNWLRFG